MLALLRSVTHSHAEVPLHSFAPYVLLLTTLRYMAPIRMAPIRRRRQWIEQVLPYGHLLVNVVDHNDMPVCALAERRQRAMALRIEEAAPIDTYLFPPTA